jgi:hypothetical protein
MATNTAERHEELHKSLDELLACFIMANPGKRLSETTLKEFIQWSFDVTKDPSKCSQHLSPEKKSVAGHLVDTVLAREKS